jgi:hypothetical protein
LWNPESDMTRESLSIDPPEFASAEVRAGDAAPIDDLSSTSARERTVDWAGIVSLGGALSLYAGLCFYLLKGEAHATGTFTFPLDDTYITMALAKNFAFHGVWGLGKSGFQSASSCPGYLLLLAAVYRVLGPSTWAPLALSVLFGFCAIVTAKRLLSSDPLPTQLIALAAIVCFVPLPVMGILGMEHTLHICLVFLFLDLFSRAYQKGQIPLWSAAPLAFAMTAVRYESLFVVFPACVLLAARKELRAALALGFTAIGPVIIMGAISAAHGTYWLPASIALKGASVKTPAHSPVDFLRHFLTMSGRAPYMAGLLFATVAFLAVPEVWRDLRRRSLLVIVAGAIVLHLCLADVGWVYRYEAYLVGAAIAAIANASSVLSFRRLGHRWAMAVLVPVIAWSGWFLYARTAEALWTVPLRSIAIYCQQIQMARFLARFEPGTVVAANDIGAISYFSDIDCVDLIGIANPDVFRLRRQGAYDTQALADLAAERHVRVAVVYDSWFSKHPIVPMGGPPIPASWIRVQRWATPNGIFLGDGIVSFYAMNPADAAVLNSALAQFDQTLPRVDQVLH